MKLDNIKVFCVNLNDRPERWAEVQEEVKVIGVEIERFPAIKRNPGWQGCLFSHLALWEKAKPLGIWMTIEDDIFFLTGAKQNLEAAIGQLPEDWDALYLGATLFRPLERVSENLLRLKCGWTTHGIIWNNQNGVVDYILKYAEDWKIDVLLADKVQEKFNCYMCFPMVATQRPGWSDIVNHHTEYREIMNRYKKYTKHEI